MRFFISKIVYFIWESIPIKQNRKNKFKFILFSKYPIFFEWSNTYKSWKTNTNYYFEENEHDHDFVFNHEIVKSKYVYFKKYNKIKKNPVRLIAFYLPQFHEIPENNLWWGKGFTEWTNVKKAKPLFDDHYQPRIPGDLGYYDLSDTSVQDKQIKLAKNYGVSGFCFYFYWFNGTRLLEKPILNYLNDSSLDFPFCLCWANENWTKRWDGFDNDVLISQKFSAKDDLNFIEYISKYFKDKRYIKIDNKPLLIIYRPNLLPSAKKTIKRWRKWCLNNGIGEIYLAYTQSFERINPSKYGFDAAIEFPPNIFSPPIVNNHIKKLKSDFSGVIHDWGIFIEKSESFREDVYKLFRGVNPGWDNSARRGNSATVFVNSSAEGYKLFLKRAIKETLKNQKNKDDNLLFINAWNEWAEGAYLEPDQGYGYSYLDATRMALEESTKSLKCQKNFNSNVMAIIIHSYYVDLLEDLLIKVCKIKSKKKLYVSCEKKYKQIVQQKLEKYNLDFLILEVANSGRDIKPFIKLLPQIINAKHEIILKIHTKKSLHRKDGASWRNDLLMKLLNPKNIQLIVEKFNTDRDLGMIGPSGHIVPIKNYIGQNKKRICDIAYQMGVPQSVVMRKQFIAGSMFFARTSSLLPILRLGFKDSCFEKESGQLDGTLAHALERIISLCMVVENLKLLSTDLKVEKTINYPWAIPTK